MALFDIKSREVKARFNGHTKAVTKVIEGTFSSILLSYNSFCLSNVVHRRRPSARMNIYGAVPEI
jgi:hypothetical protein